ncbi:MULTISPECIES: condensation domain-containing protein [unclassified Streptomyces]|uniref:phthiocerol/phthiodiolone dimycocerosyl transferase family protein n=1 Tax=unclassified Streptomyces TaxID=2593676 RepID=UPI001E59D4AD|nr:condensation domain-containing protein [Streptomyces sp. CB02980]MCB8908425.1 condensation domain-containing protein [Streptomyces sp. CB02980]
MRRKLSLSEILYVGEIRTLATTVCTVRGEVDEELLAAAFAAKVAEHRSLRSRVVRDGDEVFLDLLDEEELPRLAVHPAGPTDLTDQLNRPLPAGGPLVRATLFRGDGESTFVLGIDHVICDGHSATVLCNEIWSAYAGIQDGTYEAPRSAGESWPVAVDDLLAPCSDEDLAAYVKDRTERTSEHPLAVLPFTADASPQDGQPQDGQFRDGQFRDGQSQDGQLQDGQLQDRRPQDGRPQGGALMDVRRVRLTREQTDALVGFAKSVGVSVHGLVGAALLTAVRDGYGPGYGTDHRLSFVSPVDLRARLTPALGRDVLIPAASWYLDVVDVPAGVDPIELGRRITGRLRDGIERGEPARELQALPLLLANPAVLTASLVMPNVGSVAGPPAPPGLEITDMRKFAISSKWVPEAGAGALVASPMTVYGRLSIEMPYSARCFTPARMNEIHDHVLATLLSFVERAPVSAV